VGPVVLERETVPSADSHAQQRAGAEVEASRPDDDVELLLAVGRLDAARGQTKDRRLAEVDELDVRPVEDLVVARHEWRSFLTETIARDQLRRRFGIIDDAPNLLGEEMAPRRVRVVIEEQVGVVGGELSEPLTVPHRLVELAALLVSVVKGGAIVRQ